MIDADVPLNEEGTAFAPFSVRMLLQVRGRGGEGGTGAAAE